MANATGGTITTSGGYTIHTFNSDGTFACPAGMNTKAKVLVVAGGGGGGAFVGGGGGGGSVEYNASFEVSGSISVTVGDGGAGAIWSATTPTNPSNGENSIFSTITATGGGYGAGYQPTLDAASGGSGGGGDSGKTTGGAAGTGSNVNDGGNGQGAPNYAGGGGGGAGSDGVAASGTNAGNGGSGYTSDITGGNVNYAGGGGGGGGDIPPGLVNTPMYDAAKEAAQLQIQKQIEELRQFGQTERQKLVNENNLAVTGAEVKGKLDLQGIVNAGYRNIANIERGTEMVRNITSMFNF